jgi:hypothetical protein
MNLKENDIIDNELESWSEIKYQAKHITFEPKSALYKKRPIGLHISIAAAIILFITSSIIWFVGSNTTTLIKPSLASMEQLTKKKRSLAANEIQNIDNKQIFSEKAPFSNNNNNNFVAASNSLITNNLIENQTRTNNNFVPSNLISSQSENPTPNKEEKLQHLAPTRINYFWSPLIESFAHIENPNKENALDLHMDLLAKIDRFVDKEIGLSNNQSYDLLLPGKSNIDAQISSVGTLSQTRFQSTSSLRTHTQTEQMQMQQQFSLDAYARSLRSGFGLQTTYKQFADGAVSDYEIACIAAPKLLLTRNIILEPSMRLKLGARYANADQLKQLSFLELAPSDIRQVQIDSSMDIGRRIFYKDLDLGFGIQTPLFFINAQLDNAFKHFDYAFGNQIQDGAQNALQNWTISLGTQYASRNEKMRLSPYFIYTKMNSAVNYYTGLQFNYKNIQLGASYGNAQQYQFAAGLVGKNCALLIQSARQQLFSLSSPSFMHQVSLRFYSQPSRKARRYISL